MSLGFPWCCQDCSWDTNPCITMYETWTSIIFAMRMNIAKNLQEAGLRGRDKPKDALVAWFLTMLAIQEVIGSEAKQSLRPWNSMEIAEPAPSRARNLFFSEVWLWTLAVMNIRLRVCFCYASQPLCSSQWQVLCYVILELHYSLSMPLHQCS